MKVWQGIILGLFCGLLAAGAILVITHTPKGVAVALLPPPTPEPLVVDVSGAVNHPGVYRLPAKSRVEDAITAAGGLKQEAQADQVNLAELVRDGQKIYIPTVGEPVVAIPSKSTALDAVGTAEKLININTASQDELDQLTGIGPTKAQNIITYRDTHGPFQRIEDIINVPGIGEGIFATIKDQITVE